MVRKKYLKRIKRWLIYIHVCALVKMLRLLPRRVAIAGMRYLALIAYFLIKSRRTRTVKHLTAAFGKERSSKKIKSMAKQVFMNLGTCGADAIRIPQIMGNVIDNMITIKGREYLDRASKSGRGSILLTAHFGNWELLGAWLARNGYKLKVVGASNNNARLDKLIVETRNNAGYFNIARSSGTRDIIRGLRDGSFIGMLIDQDTKVEGVFVNFFKQWAHTAIGPVVLAMKYNLEIIPVFMRLNGDFTYHIDVQEPLRLEYTGDSEKDIIVNTQKCSDVYEKIIRLYPEQWVWMHKRWDKQPTWEAECV